MKYYTYLCITLNIKHNIMKTIVRIEHESGEGIFHSEASKMLTNADEFFARHCNFPTPHAETPKLDLDKFGKNWFCAFKSIEQMNEWVTKDEIKEFIRMKCKVLVLDVTQFQEGTHQVIFTKETIKNSKDISDLFK